MKVYKCGFGIKGIIFLVCWTHVSFDNQLKEYALKTKFPNKVPFDISL